MVGKPGCTCQPLKSVPSYAISKRSLLMGEAEWTQLLRDPGLTTGSPASHRGQCLGSYVTGCNVSSATRGAPTSASPPLRSMMEPAASTCAPDDLTSSTTSLELPPVVTTSSMTTAFSPDAI